MLSARDKCNDFNLPGRFKAVNAQNKNFASFAPGINNRAPNFGQV